jgi:hypothetical protein
MTTPTTTTIATRSGRGWAYTGGISGGLVSIAANVAHSFIPPKDAPTTWTPEAGAVVGAVVWPVFLFIAVEIMARVLWPHGPVWRILRWGGMLPVAAVAALVSYRHLSGLLAHYGEEPIVYYLGPLAVDGLMVMATGALLATGRHHTPATMAVRHSVVPTMPPATTIQPSTTDTAVPATVAGPAQSITSTASNVDVAADPAPVPGTPPVEIPTPAQLAARITTARATTRPAASATGSGRSAHTRPPRQPGGGTSASTLAPSTTDTSVSASDRAQLTPPTVPADLLAKARQVAAQYRTEHGAPITAGQLAVRLRVTSEQATQALAVLDLAPDSPTTPVRPSTAPAPQGRPGDRLDDQRRT